MRINVNLSVQISWITVNPLVIQCNSMRISWWITVNHPKSQSLQCESIQILANLMNSVKSQKSWWITVNPVWINAINSMWIHASLVNHQELLQITINHIDDQFYLSSALKPNDADNDTVIFIFIVFGRHIGIGTISIICKWFTIDSQYPSKSSIHSKIPWLLHMFISVLCNIN